MEYSKINGIYSFYEHENGKTKKVYCYIAIDKNGKKIVKYTEDENLINKLLMKYITDKGYLKSNFQKHLSEDPNIKVGSNTAPDVKAMTDNIEDEDDFYDAFNGYYDYKDNKDKKDEKKSLHPDGKQEIIPIGEPYTPGETKKDNLITRIKNSLTKKNIKKWAIRLAPAAIAVALVAGGLKLLKDSSPTKSGSLVATVQDLPDLGKTPELPAKEEEPTVTETKTSNSNENTSRNRSSSNSSSRGASEGSVKPTKEAGSINKGYENLNYQKPATLPEKEEPSKEPQEDEKYDNVIIEEEPVTDNTNDEEYDQVIEAGGNKDNANLEVPEDAIEEGSIKNESETESTEVNEDIAGTNAEVESSENTNTNEGQTAENVEEVPVTQEQETPEAAPVEEQQATTTQSTSNEGKNASTEAAAPKEKEQPATTSSAASSSTSSTEFKVDADAIGDAVERMGNGENIDIVVDSNGTVTTVPVEEEATNSLSK